MSPSPASSRAIARLYRALLNYGTKMDPGFAVRASPQGRPWGSYAFAATRLAYQNILLQQAMPSLEPLDQMLRPELFKQVVRNKFRDPERGKCGTLAASLDEGFHMLRWLGKQMYLDQCSSSQTTEGVQIDVTSAFEKGVQIDVTSAFEKMSLLGPGQPRYLFSYLVRVTNNRDHAVQVIGRSWTMTNEYHALIGHIPLTENSVVGQQPIIPAQGNECFEYASGTDCNTASGLQLGSLLVRAYGNGSDKPPTATINATIAPFQLMAPREAKLQQEEDPE